jgi:hypothetical protein
MNGDFSMQNYTLMPLFQNIKSSLQDFTHLTFDHVYRDKEPGSGSPLQSWLGNGQRLIESI